MSDYFLAPSLVRLRAEVDARFPDRDTASDGWIGDPSHQARTSSHNPLWSAPGEWSGVVRGLDVDVDDGDPQADLRALLLEATIGDPRVWYVISDRVIYSATYAWAARRYTGSNPHTQHVHVSLKETVAAWSDERPWLGPDRPPFKVRPRPVDLRYVREQFLWAVGAAPEGVGQEALNGVARIQRALNDEYAAGLVVDGLVGPATLAAWGAHERRVGVSGRPRVPDRRSLLALAKGRFEVVGG